MSTTNILDLNNRIDKLEKFAHDVEPIQQQIDELKAWTDPGTKDATGNPIILTDGAAFNAVDLKVSFEPKQSGSGTPSPTNVRPITGLTECVVDTLPNADYAPFFEGVKNGTYGFVDLSTLEWVYHTSQTNHVFTASSNPLAKATTAALTKKYTPYTAKAVTGAGTASANVPNKSIAIGSGGWNGAVVIRDDSITTVEDFINAMDGVYLIYELETPATPSYTIQQWIALVNSFNGNDASITFSQTVYGGSVDFKSGKVTVAHASIASYNGESISEPWLSSIDEYVSGTTPTTGAQVVYPLTEPTELEITPDQLELLKGYNYISTNGDNIELTYQPDTLKADILLTVSQLYGSKISIFDSILTGGDTGQVLTKTSDDNYDATWAALPATRTTKKQ